MAVWFLLCDKFHKCYCKKHPKQQHKNNNTQTPVFHLTVGFYGCFVCAVRCWCSMLLASAACSPGVSVYPMSSRCTGLTSRPALPWSDWGSTTFCPFFPHSPLRVSVAHLASCTVRTFWVWSVVCVWGGWGGVGGGGWRGGGVDVIFVADHFYLLWWLDKFFCFKLRILPLRPYDFRRTEFWKKKNYRFNLTFWDVCGLKKNKRERIFEDNCQWSSVILKVMFPVIAVPCEACWWTCLTPRNLCRGTGGGPVSVVWDGRGGGGGGVGGGVLYITPLCHHQNDFAFRWAVVWTLVKYHRIIMRGRKSQESWSGLETKFICSTARHLTARWNHLMLSDMWPLIIFISVFFKVLVSVWH